MPSTCHPCRQIEALDGACLLERNAPLRPSNFHSCLQIEEQLLFGDSAAQQPSAKRRRGAAEGSTRAAGSHAAGEPADWSALAELYAQLGQDDVLHHISSAHVVRSGPCAVYLHSLGLSVCRVKPLRTVHLQSRSVCVVCNIPPMLVEQAAGHSCTDETTGCKCLHLYTLPMPTCQA